MEKVIQSFKSRYIKWWKQLDYTGINNTRLIFLVSGWLITFLFIIFSFEKLETKWVQVWAVFHIYFWYQLNRLVVNHFRPPVDLLVLLLLSLSLLQNHFLEANLKAMPLDVGLGFFPALFLSAQIFMFGLILIQNTKRTRHPGKSSIAKDVSNIHDKKIKQGILILYVLIGFLAHYVFLFEHVYVQYIFQFFLLIILLNRTNWLEELSRPELITLFWFFIFLFYFYNDPSGIQSIKFIESTQKVTWFSLPFYLHLLIKMYLLSLVIKIPVVLIYNHATLSRKMWIAGLFQSTFPQLIQFVFLCFIFFSLISSWQAENVRRALNEQINQISRGQINAPLSYKKIPLRQGYTSIHLSEYLPTEFLYTEDTYGILSLTKSHKRAKRDYNKQDYFLFVKSEEPVNQYLYLVKIDTHFVARLTRNLSFLAGNGLILYPFSPKEWQRFVFDIKILQSEKESRIYPFAFFSLNESWSLQSTQDQAESDKERIIILGREDIFGDQKFVAGRLFIPVINAPSENRAFFAFDIYIDFHSLFTSSTTGQIIWVLILLFLLFNSFVIGQVSKFGAQINRIILDRFSQLKTGIQQIAKGNLDYKFKMEGEDEFVELAGHFNKMGIKLKDTIAQAREKDRLDHELKIARQVQLGLLPSKLPDIKGYQIAASMTTANEIGGDFYDIVPVDKNKYLFTIGDVSGKGSSAAFYMAQFISLLRYSRQFTFKPDEITLRMNKYFSTQIVDRQIFITAIIGILDLGKNQVELVRAGHTLPIFVPGDLNKGIIEIKMTGIGLGLTKTEQTFKKKIQLEKISLEPGDMLILYTDGIVEAAHPPEEGEESKEIVVYGEKRFRDLITDSREMPASDLIAVCDSDLDSFYLKYPRVDDHTLFLLQRSG